MSTNSFLKDNWIALVIVAGLGYFVYANKQATPPVVPPAPAPVVSTIVIPSLPQLVAKATPAPAKAQAIGSLFDCWAKTLSVTDTIDTTQLLRAVNTSLITMYVKAANVPSEPQIGAEIDTCLKEVLGVNPGPLDKAKAIAAFETMAKALKDIK